MKHFKKNAAIVLETLKRCRYGSRALSMSENCYKSLKKSMDDERIILFSRVMALDWCETQVNHSNRRQYRTAIYRLCDVYEYGRVLASHLYIYAQPSASYSAWINNYLASVSATCHYTDIHLKNIRCACTQFCCFAQYNGICSVEEIDYPILELYDHFLRESSKAYYIKEGLVCGFLKHLADEGLCRIGHSLFMHYIESNKCIPLRELTEKSRLAIEERLEESSIFPASEFYLTIPDFKDRLLATGYSKTVTDSAPYHLTLLYLFLDMAGLGYDRTIVEKWFEEVGKRLFSSGLYMARRTYEMYDDYVNEGDILPSHRWKHRNNSYDRLPTWCRIELNPFVEGKIKEGWSESAIDMYRLCNTRFCQFLISVGIDSFAGITPNTMKQFNLLDRHQTMEAKNAYNSRIRKFLIHLELKHLVQEGLHFALPSHFAGGEKIVEVLCQEDRERIRMYCEKASTPIELRDAAILQIGIEMGFRASDIVSLRLSDINWKSRSIRIIPEKTKVEHLHPMSIKMGNIIFRYLRDGRYKNTNSDYVFLNTKAPYDSISALACERALLRAGASTRKFHQTRKTYGSDVLRSGATIAETAELLGHADTSTVHKYTLLDTERMRLCPLSLSETDLFLEGRFGDE
jgi:site-specific recombinase XerD